MNPIAPPARADRVVLGTADNAAALAALRDRFGIEATVVEGAVTFAEVRGCAPPDFAELLARVGVPMVPGGPPVSPPVHGSRFRSAADLPRRGAELVAAQFDTVAAAADGCEALVATGVMPAGVWL